jgi:hypothetical protein
MKKDIASVETSIQTTIAIFVFFLLFVIIVIMGASMGQKSNAYKSQINELQAENERLGTTLNTLSSKLGDIDNILGGHGAEVSTDDAE